MVDAAVIVAVLTASMLHASWHALVKSTGDRVIALSGMNIVSAIASLAMLPMTRPLPGDVAWIIAGSVVLHFSYKVALARLYQHADLSQAYPLARGLTPLIATYIAYEALGELPGYHTVAGVTIVCTGLMLLGLEGRDRRIAPLGFLAAFVTSISVAGYSVIDAYGVRMTGDVLSFTIWLMLFDSFAFVAYALVTRRRDAVLSWTRDWGRTMTTGILGLISFGVFMWALGRAPVGPVSALRETSVLFSALIGTVILHERAGLNRYIAAAAISAGVAVIALGK